MKTFRIAFITGALAFALTACGSDDSSSDDEDQITESIELAATSGDPVACTENQTVNFNEQTSGGDGEDPTKSCEDSAADTPADEVEVSNIEVDGDAATADAAITGSFLGGQTLEIALVKEDDKWKLDELVSFVEYDASALAESIASDIEDDPEGAAPGQIECVSTAVSGLSQEDAEGLFLRADSALEEQVFGTCFGSGQ